MSEEPTPEQKARNLRLALVFAALALTFFFGSFFFLPR